MNFRRWHTLLLPPILAALTACGPIRVPWIAEAPKETAENSIVGTRGVPAVSTSRRQVIGEQLKAEKYRPALELVRKEIGGGVPEASLAEEYGQALNGVLDAAEIFQENSRSEEAGPLFRLAYEGYPATAAVAKRAKLTRPEIEARIDACADELMNRGLVAYRGGDLAGAIETWKMIQTFDPLHQVSRKALETTEVQRVNLEKVRSAN